MATDLEIAQLIGTRLCHDLAGPVGAISAGVELIADDPDMVDAESLGLIGGSAAAASRKLTFLRIAFGSLGKGSGSLETLSQSFEDYLTSVTGPSGCATVTWFDTAMTDSLQRRFDEYAAPLIANAALFVYEAAPGAAHLTFTCSEDAASIAVEAICVEGRQLPIRDDLISVISGVEDVPLSPRTIQAYVTRRIAVEAAIDVSASSTGTGLRLTLKSG